ncbi:hypothetical protein [Thermococcus sp.]
MLKERDNIFLLGYYLGGPVLNSPLDKPIPTGSKLIVLKGSISTGKS